MTPYKLTEETKEHDGITLHRIELTDDCQWGKRGTKGGWIQSRGNLTGDAWVSEEAYVFGNALVSENACVCGNARVYGNAHVSGDAHVSENARVYGNAHICGNARVSSNALVIGDAQVSGYAHVCGNARVSGNALVIGDANVNGNAQVHHSMSLTSGEWDSTPMYIQIPNGPTMNMSAPGILRIGGDHKSINDWLKDEKYKYRSFVWVFADYYGF